MTKAPDLSKLSVAEKDALILALFEQLAMAHQRIGEQDKTIAEQAERIAALEAKLERLNRPSKTPDNSSMPPSKGQKKDRAEPDHDRPRRKSRPGAGRSLHANPDRVIDATLRRQSVWSRARLSANPLPRWWSTCTTPMPLACSDWRN